VTGLWVPALAVLLVWWSATGLILLLDSLPRRTFGRSLTAASALAAAALFGLAATSGAATPANAYAAFACAVAVWGWQELAFLTGYVTGPRRHGCPPGCDGTRHFVHAVEAILYHEFAIAACAAAVVLLTWGEPNQVGTWTFLVLWVMRQSAKLNLFLGVRNPGTEFLPPHLRYLASYFRRRPMNLLFPISVAVPAAVLVLIVQTGLAPGATEFDATAAALVGTLVALAILEHLLLVLPLPASLLWGRSRESADAAPPRARARGDVGSPDTAGELIHYRAVQPRSARG